MIELELTDKIFRCHMMKSELVNIQFCWEYCKYYEGNTLKEGKGRKWAGCSYDGEHDHTIKKIHIIFEDCDGRYGAQEVHSVFTDYGNAIKECYRLEQEQHEKDKLDKIKYNWECEPIPPNEREEKRFNVESHEIIE